MRSCRSLEQIFSLTITWADLIDGRSEATTAEGSWTSMMRRNDTLSAVAIEAQLCTSYRDGHGWDATVPATP